MQNYRQTTFFERIPMETSMRKLAVASILLYPLGILLVLIGTSSLMIGLASVLSQLPTSVRIPLGDSEGALLRFSIGITLVAVGFILQLAYIFYACFKLFQFINKGDFSNWGTAVGKIGKFYFLSMLFIIIGLFIIPGTTDLYGRLIMFLIASAMIMTSASLAPFPQQSLLAGTFMIIATVIMFLAGRIEYSLPAGILPQRQIISPSLQQEVFAAYLAMVLLGIALLIRTFITSPLPTRLILIIAGLVYTSGIAYTYLEAASYISRLPSSLPTLIRVVAPNLSTAYEAWYYASLSGFACTGIAGIMGIIATLLALFQIITSEFPTLKIMIGPPPPPPPPPPPSRYCPQCGSPVRPDDKYCGNCGTKLG